ALEASRRALGEAHQAGGDRRELIRAVPRQIPRCGEKQPVRRDGDRVGDPRYAIGEVREQPTKILRCRHASCSLPACEVCGPAGFGSAVVQSLGCVRPRCTPRWYADNNPRTASGVRRWLLLAALSTPPGTNCAMGTRFGRPAAVVSVTGTSAAAEAARQPTSAAVCQSEVESRR